MNKLLVQEKKGYTYRLRDTESKEVFRALERDFKNIDFIIGSLFECEYTHDDDLLTEINIIKEIVGDSEKTRVEVNIEDFSVGDLIDGVPILRLGRRFARGGKKLAYARL